MYTVDLREARTVDIQDKRINLEETNLHYFVVCYAHPLRLRLLCAVPRCSMDTSNTVDLQDLLSVAANLESQIERVQLDVVVAKSRTERLSSARAILELRLSKLSLSNAKLEHAIAAAPVPPAVTSTSSYVGLATDIDPTPPPFHRRSAQSAVEGWNAFEALAVATRANAVLDSSPHLDALKCENLKLTDKLTALETEVAQSEEEQEMPCSEPLTLTRLQQRLSRLLKQQQELEAAL